MRRRVRDSSFFFPEEFDNAQTNGQRSSDRLGAKRRVVLLHSYIHETGAYTDEKTKPTADGTFPLSFLDFVTCYNRYTVIVYREEEKE